MKTLLLALSILLLTACTPQKRLERLIDRHPNLVTWRTDTVRVRDTLVLPEIRHDTLVVTSPRDTVLVQADRVTVRIERIVDTLKVSIKAPADTVFREIKVPVQQGVAVGGRGQIPWQWVLAGMGLLLLIVILKPNK